MNNRYLCKAKTDNGEWVKGHVLSYKDKVFICSAPYVCMEGYSNKGGFFGFGDFMEVDESTLCRCTGKPDEKNVLIYENDIIWDYDEEEYGLVVYDEEDLCFYVCIENDLIAFGEYTSNDFDIRGNIFDNPELLEGDRNE